jgi:hypothetical protein
MAAETRGSAALEVRHPSTAKMTHAAAADVNAATTAAAKMTHAAAADVNAATAATAATAGELRPPGLRRKEQHKRERAEARGDLPHRLRARLQQCLHGRCPRRWF